MLKIKHVQASSRVFGQNRLLKFIVVALAVGYIHNVYTLQHIRNNERTIIIPPVINSRIELTGNRTSESYVREYVNYVMPLALSYSSGTARKQFEELLISWQPGVLDEARKRFYILADQIEQTKAISSFYVYGIKHDSEKKTIEVEGNRRLTQQEQQIENLTKEYVITYSIENGRFWLTGLKEKEKAGEEPKPAAEKNGGKDAKL